MPQQWCCPNGHTWQNPTEPGARAIATVEVCPVCGTHGSNQTAPRQRPPEHEAGTLDGTRPTAAFGPRAEAAEQKPARSTPHTSPPPPPASPTDATLARPGPPGRPTPVPADRSTGA